MVIYVVSRYVERSGNWVEQGTNNSVAQAKKRIDIEGQQGERWRIVKEQVLGVYNLGRKTKGSFKKTKLNK